MQIECHNLTWEGFAFTFVFLLFVLLNSFGHKPHKATWKSSPIFPWILWMHLWFFWIHIGFLACVLSFMKYYKNLKYFTRKISEKIWIINWVESLFRDLSGFYIPQNRSGQWFTTLDSFVFLTCLLQLIEQKQL